MKKLLISSILFFLLFSNNTFGQLQQGTTLLGGGAAYVNVNSTGVLSINPNVGIFVVDNLALGLGANSVHTSNRWGLSLAPFIRLYAGGNDSGSLFIYGSGLFGRDSVKHSSTETGWLAGGGYAIFLNRSIAMEFTAGYNKVGRSGFFATGIGFQIHLSGESE